MNGKTFKYRAKCEHCGHIAEIQMVHNGGVWEQVIVDPDPPKLPFGVEDTLMPGTCPKCGK